jgi:DnaJ homolog subfamily A member 2
MIAGAGMPSYRHHHPGNMYITFDVEFPSKTILMKDAEKDMLKTVLGLPVKSKQEKAAAIAAKSQHRQRDPNGMMLDNEDDLEVDPLAPEIPPGSLEEEFQLEEVDSSGAERANRAAMDEDDDDGLPPGAERMQCASQ